MKYYETYRQYVIDDAYDWSYPSPEVELLWRLDELQDRLEELTAGHAPYVNGYFYSDDDIRYALPNQLRDISKAERAIELAKNELVDVYGLPDPDTFISAESEPADEINAEQLSVFENLSDEQPEAA